MKFKKRIKRRPDRPSLFKYPLFYFFIIILLLITALYQLKIKGVLRELEKKDLSTHLKSEGEELSHLLFHQFFVLSLKKENVKLILKSLKRILSPGTCINLRYNSPAPFPLNRL